MTTRDALHDLIDELPESALPQAERYLAALRDGVASADPDGDVDDEPLLPETEATIEAARAAYARGEFLTDAELDALLAREDGVGG